jgi:5-methylcytosine-specific restriction protein A
VHRGEEVKLKTLRPRLATLNTSRITTAPLGTDRLRGRAAVDRRARWLELHPLCAECDKEGQVTAGHVVDHITPLWKGGADDYETNGQTLCNPHHDAKSKAEAAERARGG